MWISVLHHGRFGGSFGAKCLASGPHLSLPMYSPGGALRSVANIALGFPSNGLSPFSGARHQTVPEKCAQSLQCFMVVLLTRRSTRTARCAAGELGALGACRPRGFANGRGPHRGHRHARGTPRPLLASSNQTLHGRLCFAHRTGDPSTSRRAQGLL